MTCGCHKQPRRSKVVNNSERPIRRNAISGQSWGVLEVVWSRGMRSLRLSSSRRSCGDSAEALRCCSHSAGDHAVTGDRFTQIKVEHIVELASVLLDVLISYGAVGHFHSDQPWHVSMSPSRCVLNPSLQHPA